MGTEPTKMPFSELLTSTSILSNNIKLNAEKMGRYGLSLPAFTDTMDADLQLANTLNMEQERLKSELKLKTQQLAEVQERLQKNYAIAKKTIKLAEPQTNWIAYGIADKR